MVEWLHGIVQGHGTWFVAVIIFLESMGAPLPGESLLIGAAVYAATMGGLQIEWVVLYAAIGAIMGDNAGYLLGRVVGRRALQRWGGKIGLTEKRLVLGEYLFQKHGAKVVFFGRFTAFLRTFAALLAGATRMPWPRFLLWNALGGVCWTAGYGYGAFLLGDQVHNLLGPIGLGLGVIALGLIIWLIVFVRRHESRLMREAEEEMARQEAARTARLRSKHAELPAKTAPNTAEGGS